MTAPFAIDIGELVLDGFGPVSRRRVAAVTERHLASLIARRGLPDVARHAGTDSLPAMTVHLGDGAGATEIGRAIADAVYQGLTS